MAHKQPNDLLNSKNAASLEAAAALMKFLSNPQRLALLCYLGEEECSVGDLADMLGMSPSALSQHLTRLKEAKIVTTRREHNKIFYKLTSKKTMAIIKALKKIYC